ncbi:hypothetical protein BJV74DRAFT_436106 [Russula compacta]|nr:hypothetical protein BJV74DRAFT_436106 [Russula compacta]
MIGFTASDQPRMPGSCPKAARQHTPTAFHLARHTTRNMTCATTSGCPSPFPSPSLYSNNYFTSFTTCPLGSTLAASEEAERTVSHLLGGRRSQFRHFNIAHKSARSHLNRLQQSYFDTSAHHLAVLSVSGHGISYILLKLNRCPILSLSVLAKHITYTKCG